MNAMVNISLADLDRIRSERTKFEAEAAELRKQNDALRVAAASGGRLDDGGGVDGARMQRALHLALAIVRFGIAHLDPLTVRGWPHAELLELAEMLKDVPGVSPENVELWMDWRIFARRAAEWEAARAAGTEQEKLAEENAGKRPGTRYTDHLDFDGAENRQTDTLEGNRG